jgi:hypothetical protein
MDRRFRTSPCFPRERAYFLWSFLRVLPPGVVRLLPMYRRRSRRPEKSECTGDQEPYCTLSIPAESRTADEVRKAALARIQQIEMISQKQRCKSVGSGLKTKMNLPTADP